MTGISQTSKPMFRDFREFSTLNARAMRRVVAKCDLYELATALAYSSREVRVAFLVHLKPAAALEMREMMSVDHDSSEVAAAKAAIVGIANDLCRTGEISARRSRSKASRGVATRPIPLSRRYDEDLRRCMRAGSQSPMPSADLVQFFTALAGIVQCRGVLSLAGVLEGDKLVHDALVRTGIELIIAGVETEQVLLILNNRKRAIVAAVEQRCELIVSGLQAVALGVWPRIVQEICGSFVCEKTDTSHS